MWKIRRFHKANKYFCEHCDKNLTRSQYFKHKQKYFNVREATWRGKGDFNNGTRFSVSDPFDQSSSDKEPMEADGDGAESDGKCPAEGLFKIQ